MLVIFILKRYPQRFTALMTNAIWKSDLIIGLDTMLTIANRLQHARETIDSAAHTVGRDPNHITLLAVSKTKPISDIKEAFQAGQRCFGENYVQEGVEKIQALAEFSSIQWHFIGPLQSNKTRDVAEHFAWVQSLDRLKIAQRLNEQRPDHLPALQVCIQVNISEEASKSGILSDQVNAFAAQIAALPRLCLRGLMAIPAATQDQQAQADAFAKMAVLFHQLQQSYNSVDTLSMGMSGDMQPAIQAGSTMVRIGTAIFGKRENNAPPQ